MSSWSDFEEAWRKAEEAPFWDSETILIFLLIGVLEAPMLVLMIYFVFFY